MPARSHLLTATFRVPGGRLAVIVDPSAVGDRPPTDGGAVVFSSFRGPDDERAPGARRASLPQVQAILERYADGELDALDEVSVVQPGSAFRQRAWAAMRTIAAGRVDSYAGLARRAGSPNAFRAAGTVCSSNLVAPFVPCHRVIASQGRIGGYGYGLDVKRALLEHEGVEL